MGLGSLVEFVPVMENDCHCNVLLVFKGSEYAEGTDTLRLTTSGSAAVSMLHGCFTDKSCEPLSDIKSSIVMNDYHTVDFADDYQSEIQNCGSGDVNRKCILENRVVSFHGNGLKTIPSSGSEIPLKALSPVGEEYSKDNTLDKIDLKRLATLEDEASVDQKGIRDWNSGHPDAPLNSLVANGSVLHDGSPSKAISIPRTYPPITISVATTSESDRQACSISGNNDHKGLLKKAVQNVSSLSYFRMEQKPSPAFSTSDDGLVLLNEQTLNKALDLFKIPSIGISAQSSTLPSPASMRASTCTSPSGRKEVAKRKTMQERLIRLPRLITTCPQLEHAPTMHWAMLLRRFKKYYPVAEYISEELIQHVLNEEHGYSQASVETRRESPTHDNAYSFLHGSHTISDPNATESSSDEDENLPGPSTSRENRPHISRESASYRYLKEQIEICAQDFRAAQIIEDCDREIQATKLQLTELRGRKSLTGFRFDDFKSNDPESSARCRPYSSHIRRRLLKVTGRESTRQFDVATSLDSRERVRAYASIDDRVYSNLSSLKAVPLERRMQAYIKRRASRPLKFLQQRSDCPMWKSRANSASKSWEEQQRVRKEIFERTSEGAIARDCRALRKARRNNHSNKSVSPLKRAGKRLVKRSLDQKRNGDRYSSSRSRTRHLEKRRNVQFLPRIFREFNNDDSSLQEAGLPGLPPKIDYKEICIPPWKYAPIDYKKMELDVPCLHLAEGATPAEISRRHLPLELSERKRFQQYRDFVASKSAAGAGSLTSETATSKLSAMESSKLAGTGGAAASSFETASSACSRAQSPIGPSSLDDERHSSVNDFVVTPDYDRPSVATPYTPRHFPLSSPLCQNSP